MSRVGFDWLTVELEHSPTSFETAAQIFATVAAAGVSPLCRVPWNTGENIKRVLDTGAWGVIVPMVNSRAEAEAAVAAARYQPQGSRSIGGQLHAASFDTDPATYYARANEEILVVLMAEHIQAIENAERSAACPASTDCSLVQTTCTTQWASRRHSTARTNNLPAPLPYSQTARKHGIAPGIHVLDAAAAQRRIAEGFQFIAITSEAGMMLAKADEFARTLGLGQGRTIAKY
jgi:4-hydroxy-2-oxoheptanedioate aldolase